MSTVQIPEYTTDPFFGLEDKWIETAEGELTHYHEVGEGTPILFLHGSGTGVSAAANWWLNLPSIGEQARCIAIDTIGYGQTVVAPNTAYGIRAWVDHAVRTLDALGIEKTWLVGNSLGGWLAFHGCSSSKGGKTPMGASIVHRGLRPPARQVPHHGTRQAFCA